MKRCCRCLAVTYCSVECQEEDYENHREECRLVSSARRGSVLLVYILHRISLVYSLDFLDGLPFLEQLSAQDANFHVLVAQKEATERRDEISRLKMERKRREKHCNIRTLVAHLDYTHMPHTLKVVPFSEVLNTPSVTDPELRLAWDDTFRRAKRELKECVYASLPCGGTDAYPVLVIY